MKKLYDASKQKVIEKLKYISSILDIVSNIVKSFATIIGYIVSGTTAGVTGYYETKKIFKKERLELSKMSDGDVGEGSSGLTAISGTASSSADSRDGYYFDMNSGAFILSLVMLSFLVFKKVHPKP